MDPLTLPSYLFGLSVASPALESLGAENLLRDAGKPGWLVVSLDLGSLTANLDFSALALAGFSVIVELNPPSGDFPVESHSDLFAQECASVVESARGANLWLIGHETNRAHVPPAHYAATFAKCRLAIKSLPAHHDDWVMPAPPAVDDASGDWIKYFQDILFQCTQLDARPDALALHLSTRGHAASLIESDDKSETFPNRHLQFRAYRDFLGAVPPALRHLPVLITAAAPVEWHNENTGWINRACAEINAWNVVTNHQPIQALCIVPGKQVWIIFIDVHILDDCGNILDAASLGAIAALLSTRVPASKFGLGEDYMLPVNDIPVATTAIEFSDVLMFDPGVDEESIANTRLTVITTAKGEICGMQKSGKGLLKPEQIYRIVDIACEKAKEIREKFLEV